MGAQHRPQLLLWFKTFGPRDESLIPPFHWTAFLLRFEILIKMLRNAAETPKAQQKRQERSRNVSETS